MRIITTAISLLLLLSGCSMKSGLEEQAAQVKSEIIRQADWEAEFRDVLFLNAKQGWVIGEEGTILYTSDGGANWEPQTSGTEVRLNKMQFIDKKRGWIVGDGGTFLSTTDGGRHWRQQVLTDGSLISLHFLDSLRGWVTGEGGALYYTPNGGKSWEFRRTGIGEALVAIHFVNPMEGWLIAQLGTTLHTTDGGETWEMESVAPRYSLLGIQFDRNEQTGWAVGIGATILSTTDGGKSWNRGEPGIADTHAIHDLYFTDTKNGWLVAQAGDVLHTQDGGQTWTVRKTDTRNDLLAVHSPDGKHTSGRLAPTALCSTPQIRDRHGQLIRKVPPNL